MQRYTPRRGDGVDYESFMLMGESESHPINAFKLQRGSISQLPGFAELTLFFPFAVHWDPHR